MKVVDTAYEVVSVGELPAGAVFVYESEAYVKTIGDSCPRAVRCLTGCLCTFREDTTVEHKPHATLYVDGVIK